MENIEAVVSLLKKHITPSTGNATVLVGAQVEPITASLTSSFYDHRFDFVADPMAVIANINANSSGNQTDSVELVCLLDAFQELTNLNREHVLCALRDSMVRRILHFEYEPTDEDGWSLTNSLSLGFRRIDKGASSQGPWQLFEFDINSYKSTPGWLNADHWCNPHQWERNRW